MPSSWFAQATSSVTRALDRFFCISERGSSIATECRAGTAAFLTMSYLLLVNPQIMSQAGVSHSNAVLATALSSAVASIVVGIWGNLPFGFAPGLGLSAYLSYGLVLSGAATLEESLTACFASGVMLCIFSLSGLSHLVMHVVPRSIKLAIVVGMGILVAMIGMVSVNLVVASDKTLVTMGDLLSWELQVCILGVILVGSLLYHDVQGGILIGIAALTLIFWVVDSSFPDHIWEVPKVEGEANLDFGCLWQADRMPVIWTAIGAFVFICIFDVSGVMFGLATLSGLMEEDGTIPKSLWGFLGSSAGTLVAAFLGSTPVICTVECAAGVKEGGKTGLTAVVIGIYFLLSVFLAPLFAAVPEEATAPVLILVGALMMGESGKIDWESMDSAVPGFLTIVMMPLTYSITNGMVFGLFMSAAFYITTGAAFKDIAALFTRKTDDSGEGGSDLDNLNNHPLEEDVYTHKKHPDIRLVGEQAPLTATTQATYEV